MGLEQAVLGAEVAAAEAAVADDALYLLLALVRRVLFVVARWLFRHAAADWQCQVQRCLAADGEL